jgi:type III secretion protein V
MNFKKNNFVIPLMVVLIASSMVIPLPVFLLDFLLAGNLVLSILLLVSAFTIPDILRLSAFPTLILLATLYRLSLNISTTRLLLSEGNVGQVISTLARYMTNGNLAVGFVVFTVISIVQFLVIAKGSERVAEVSARFTLDAMPGRQMSIDAELRAGGMTVEQAQARRKDLQTESQFYGALDGAMKFVKGDAIAGMLIAVVNLIGGILVGVVLNGDSILKAVELYTFYTIGDGLVAQVPAVLNSLAAGVIVTRVGGDGRKTLASDIGEQLLQSPGVQLGVGIGCLGLGCMPGMPWLAFIIFGFGLLVSAFYKTKCVLQSIKQTAVETKPPTFPESLEILIPSELLKAPELVQRFCDALEREREKVFEDVGIFVTRPHVKGGPDDGEIQVLLRGVAVGALVMSEFTVDAIEEYGISCFRVIRSLLVEIFDDKSTNLLLSYYESQNGDLVSSVVPEMVSVTELTVILRSLIQEGVSVRNIDIILQAIGECVPKMGKDRVLHEEIRIRLGRFISNRHFAGKEHVPTVSLSPRFEFRCTRLEREVGVLEYSEVQEFHGFLMCWSGKVTALVVARGARGFIQEYVRGLGFDLPVIGREEIRSASAVTTVAFFDPGVDQEPVSGEGGVIHPGV